MARLRLARGRVLGPRVIDYLGLGVRVVLFLGQDMAVQVLDRGSCSGAVLEGDEAALDVRQEVVPVPAETDVLGDEVGLLPAVAMDEDGAGAMGAGVLNSGNLDARVSRFFFSVA